jgi:hypothetical protein
MAGEFRTGWPVVLACFAAAILPGVSPPLVLLFI